MQTKAQWTMAEARAQLALATSSGLSIRAYSRGEGLDEERFYRWRRRLAAVDATPDASVPRRRSRSRKAKPGFVDVTPSGALAATGDVPVLELVLPRGMVVRVPTRFDEDTLRRLVAALGGPPC